ncbi:MAG: alanine glycine permease [Micavibrio sp.]|nr:alanine glycine permease [Micavibrio sp.]|tara:strand:- start:2950 stop:4395 length:1446 start_codon:yes stop_codon:yes gene_type:complete
MSIDQAVDTFVAPFADKLFSIIFYSITLYQPTDAAAIEVPLIVLWLIAAGVFFTFYLGLPNIRLFKHATAMAFDNKDNKSKGDISSFQALMTTLSATVGLGNIAGVAIAVSVGGPGAVVWMVLTGFFGMATKFVETALAVKYRVIFKDGHISGGPMYYLKAGFDKHKQHNMGAFMAAFFCVCCIAGSIGGGNLFQSNQAYQQVVNVTGGDVSWWADKGWLFGILLGCLVASVILGGIKSIAKVASKIVPIMGIMYMLAGLVVIAVNYQNIIPAFATIFTLAFTVKAGFGGLLGAIIMGVQRGAFSNEAGFGSAPIGHAAAKTDSHISQGLAGMLGPFIDTVIICTITGLVITISGVYTEYQDGMAGVSLTSKAFADTLSWFPYVLSVTVFLFAFSTMISWSYYGVKATTYLFKESPIARDSYKVIFCLCTVIGTTGSLDSVIKLTDAMIFAMAIPNIIGLYMFAREVKTDMNVYTKALKKK